MGDYIKREAAINALTTEAVVRNMDSAGGSVIPCVVRASRRVIAVLPAADVRENVLGKWLDTVVAFHLKCSECGCIIYANKSNVFLTHNCEYNFCPNCGADMRRLKDYECFDSL